MSKETKTQGKHICITNRHLVHGDFLMQIEKVCRQKPDYLILREKDLSESEYKDLACSVLKIAQSHSVKCIFHTFVAVAKELNHPHIHVTMSQFLNLSKEERNWFQTIGVSTHRVNEAVTAEKQGASYVTASHIFPTDCKAGLAPKGLTYLREVTKSVSIPVYALGGIHPDNEQSCIDAGAAGVCMMSEYMNPFSTQESEYYDRQIRMKEIGIEGQQKLKNARVLIVGAGGLGSPASMYLAGAGIGTLGIMDADVVSLTNLHRQLIHPLENTDKNKALSAKEQLEKHNPFCNVIPYPYLLTEENAKEVFADYDFIIDAVDNFEAKFLINDTCVKLKKPFCHAGVLAYQGQLLTYVPDLGPCYRCIFEEIPQPGTVPTSQDVGILGATAGILGCMQALETIKYITGTGELFVGKMLIFNGLTLQSRVVKFPNPSPNCTACQKHEQRVASDSFAPERNA